MNGRIFFFAGGGTGGHIYPALAVAEQITRLELEAKIHFFVSSREIDSKILSQTDFKYTQLPAKGFSARPAKLIEFVRAFLKSSRIAEEIISKSENPTVIGIGGFVSASVCRAAHKLGIDVKLLNVDIVPGRANKITSRWADEIFVQFEETAKYFTRRKAEVHTVGCPLRSGFKNPQPAKAMERIGLDKNKKTLLITGASSGSQNINDAVCSLLDKLSAFADTWQIVHLAGKGNFEKVNEKYAGAKISYKILDYCDEMADLLAASDLVIGRSGAVSVAEYAAAGVASICMPYPYHKDMHQYLNAGKLVAAGAAIIVDDLPDEKERTEWLAEELEGLMKDDVRLEQMGKNCEAASKKDAAFIIAEKLLTTQIK